LDNSFGVAHSTHNITVYYYPCDFETISKTYYTRRFTMQDLHLLQEHLGRMAEELMEVKTIAMRLEIIDNEKAARAGNDLMSASEEISQKGGSVSSGGN
jgi:head-tail adaptor